MYTRTFSNACIALDLAEVQRYKIGPGPLVRGVRPDVIFGIRPRQIYSTLLPPTLILLESAQVRYTLHCSWNPPNLQNSPLGNRPIREIQHETYTKRAHFLTPSSVQVPCPSSGAHYFSISPRAMHRRLSLKSAQTTTTANTRMCESDVGKGLSLSHMERLK